MASIKIITFLILSFNISEDDYTIAYFNTQSEMSAYIFENQDNYDFQIIHEIPQTKIKNDLVAVKIEWNWFNGGSYRVLFVEQDENFDFLLNVKTLEKF